VRHFFGARDVSSGDVSLLRLLLLRDSSEHDVGCRELRAAREGVSERPWLGKFQA